MLAKMVFCGVDIVAGFSPPLNKMIYLVLAECMDHMTGLYSRMRRYWYDTDNKQIVISEMTGGFFFGNDRDPENRDYDILKEDTKFLDVLSPYLTTSHLGTSIVIDNNYQIVSLKENNCNLK